MDCLIAGTPIAIGVSMIWTLLVIMKFKHYIADYLLQGRYMLGKFKMNGWEWPLAAHCGVHFLFTFIIALFNQPIEWAIALAFLDFTIHFIMDRIKAAPYMLGRYQALSKSEMIKLMESRQNYISFLNNTKNEDDLSVMKLEVELSLVQIDKEIKSNTYFWWALGFDQMIHGLTDLFIVYMIINL